MDLNSKIFLAGHTGLAGSALLRSLKSKGYTNFLFTPFPEYDLTNQKTVEDFFKKEKPEYVILAAAKVGGIVANDTYRGQFIYENLMIQSNVIHQSYLYGVKKLLFLGSSCIYPKNCAQPMKEEFLLTDVLEYTNEPYAIAKIAGIKMVESYNLQYGTNYIAVMPTNLYGFYDNFDLEKSHVLPAIIRKLHLGKCLMYNDWKSIRSDFKKYPVENISGNATENEILDKLTKYGITKSNETCVELWGTGSPMREFLNSDDLADACIYLMQKINFTDILKQDFNINSHLERNKLEIRNNHINIGTGHELTIGELAEIIKKIVGYEGKIFWNKEKPDGTPRKLLDVTKLNNLGWKPSIPLESGIKKLYDFYTLNDYIVK